MEESCLLNVLLASDAGRSIVAPSLIVSGALLRSAVGRLVRALFRVAAR